MTDLASLSPTEREILGRIPCRFGQRETGLLFLKVARWGRPTHTRTAAASEQFPLQRDQGDSQREVTSKNFPTAGRGVSGFPWGFRSH